MSNSILKRDKRVVNNGRYERSDRFSYYVATNFCIDGIDLHLSSKIDTGSPYTIMSRRLIEEQGVNITKRTKQPEGFRELVSVSGSRISVNELIVEDFRLTEEIIFSKIKIYESPDIEDRALIGMDILSLFDFKYEWGTGNMFGTFWIIDYENRMQEIKRRCKTAEYIDSKQIFLLDRE